MGEGYGWGAYGGDLLRPYSLARLEHFGKIVVRLQILVTEQLWVEMDLSLEAGRIGAYHDRLNILHGQYHFVRLQHVPNQVGARRYGLRSESSRVA